jgi:hypothetical protein
VAGCCEYGDEPSGSGATELVNITEDQCSAGYSESRVSIIMKDFSLFLSLFYYFSSLTFSTGMLVSQIGLEKVFISQLAGL